jgi:hypothetical protein
MKKQFTILVLVLLILVSGIGIVSAETLTGTWGSGGDYNTSTCTYGAVGGGVDYTNATYLKLNNTEYLTPLVSMVRWDGPAANDKAKFRVSNPTTPGEATPFIGYIGNTQVVTGTIGYQRYWDWLGTEQIGYQYVIFNTWNLTGFTGTQYLNMSYNHANLHYLYYYTFGSCGVPPVGFTNMRMGTTLPNGDYDVLGTYLWTKYDSFTHTYTVTSPAGLGISGGVDKLGYSSKIYIVNATSNIPIISEYSISSVNYNFTSLTQPIYFSAYSSLGQWYNSTTLFSTQSVTPTPTPTPTVTLNPGEFWLTFSSEDATTGGLIPGAEIDIYSEFAGTWNNATTSSGERTIILTGSRI